MTRPPPPSGRPGAAMALSGVGRRGIARAPTGVGKPDAARVLLPSAMAGEARAGMVWAWRRPVERILVMLRGGE